MGPQRNDYQSKVCIIYIYIYSNIFVTMVILGLTTGLAILFPKLRSMISLVGGIGDVIIVFIVPGN